jgi:hypothetical protein
MVKGICCEIFCIRKQKVVWILKLRENGWEAAASALTPPPILIRYNIGPYFLLIIRYNYTYGLSDC